MFGRSLRFGLLTVLSMFAAGCLLDGGPFQAEGGGGSGASPSAGGGGAGGGITTTTATDPGGAGGGTTGGTTSTTSSTSTTTTSTTGPTCQTSDECTALGFCSQGTCSGGSCSYMPKPLGTFISNPDPADCKRFVCDGDGQQIAVPEDTETPPPSGNECQENICDAGNIVPKLAVDGLACGGPSGEYCKANVCLSGQCVLQSFPDQTTLTDDDPSDCAIIQCFGGDAYYVAVDSLCPDGNPNNCFVPKCSVDSMGGTCNGVNAPQGQACKKQDNSGGQCNSQGQCI